MGNKTKFVDEFEGFKIEKVTRTTEQDELPQFEITKFKYVLKPKEGNDLSGTVMTITSPVDLGFIKGESIDFVMKSNQTKLG